MLKDPMDHLIQIMYGYEAPSNEAEEVLHYVFTMAAEGKKMKDIVYSEELDIDAASTLQLEYIVIGYTLGQELHSSNREIKENPNKQLH